MIEHVLKKYSAITAGLIFTLLVNMFSHPLYEHLEKSLDPHLAIAFFALASLCVLGFFVQYAANYTGLPSFVVAIFFGMSSRGLLEPIVHNTTVLSIIVGLGATLILFGGGIETPWENFKRLLSRIISLSFGGLALTAVLFSCAVYALAQWLHNPLPVAVAVLLGAVLASTDPASIIPILKQFKFHNRDTRDIIVSESAVTDVTGTLLTVVLLAVLATGTTFTSVQNGYAQLISNATVIFAGKQILFGILFGVLGWLLLELLSKFKKRHAEEYEADAAFFLFVPIVIFSLAIMFGGSGYLAAFIAGLLFVIAEHLHVTEKYFNHTIEGFLKPAIFLLLGALVNPAELVHYAPVGILAALVFMAIIRPIAVLVTLAPFSLFQKNGFSWREIAFISFVRETGAIPAVLLVTLVASGIPGLTGLVPVGMWVILGTLIIQPLLTPLVAKKLQVGEPI